MVERISSLGIFYNTNSNLSSSNSLLSKLTEQQTTGYKSTNLTDYTASEAQQLLNAASTINEQEGYLDVIATLETRMETYDTTLTGIEDTIATITSAITSASTYDETNANSLATQLDGAMSQMTYYLNQKVGDRYIYSGTRYTTAPVCDITTLPIPPTETAPYTTSGNEVPSYDTQYDALDPEKEIAAANINTSVAIDDSSVITYGVNSNQEGFQQIIMGLRYAYAATQDPENYRDYLDIAKDLLAEGTANIRAYHTSVSNTVTRLESAQTLIENKISSLKDQADEIASVDLNEVALKITLLQTQLEASYSATAILLNLSLSDYI